MSRLSTLIAALVMGSCFAASASEADCRRELAELDRRVATLKLDTYRQQAADNLRMMLTQGCQMMTPQIRAEVMKSMDAVLPAGGFTDNTLHTTSEAAVGASAVISAVPPAFYAQGRAVAQGFVDRQEDMLNLYLQHWDVLNGHLRVLYSTAPSLSQQARPDWAVFVYVVVISPQGQATQHLVLHEQRFGQLALALVPGRDEVVIQRAGSQPQHPTTIERWSVRGGARISSIQTPVPSFGECDKSAWLPFKAMTSDSMLLFAKTSACASGAHELHWYKSSLQGDVMARGTLPLGAGGAAGQSFVAVGQGRAVGLISQSMERDEAGVESRVLRIDGGSAILLAPVIARSMLPGVGQGLADALAQQYQTRATHSIVSRNIGLSAVDMIDMSHNSVALLMQVTASKRQQPAVHGRWLSVLGKSLDDYYLEPLAESLQVEFEAMAVDSGGRFALYGEARTHEGLDYLVLLSRSAEPVVRTVVQRPANGRVEFLQPDANGAWLFGFGYPGTSFDKHRFWYQRIEH